jgi:hypothetical protein
VTLPAGIDPRAQGLGALELVEIDTPDGAARFLLGQDGSFQDVNGLWWRGARLGSVTELQSALQGAAPSGRLTLSYFQDPAAPDLVGQLQALGADYVRGREVRFLVQFFHDPGEVVAPTTAPVLWLTRIMTELSFSASGPRDRSIAVGFETAAQYREAARRLQFNIDGHASLIGYPNPSLTYAPTIDYQEEPLFG